MTISRHDFATRSRLGTLKINELLEAKLLLDASSRESAAWNFDYRIMPKCSCHAHLRWRWKLTDFGDWIEH
jgi:hypothetical protein